MIGKHVHKLNFGLKPLLLVTSIIAMAVPMTFGQAHRSLMRAFLQAATQPANPLTFDVVSVKRNESDEANSRMKMMPDGIQLLNVWPAIAIREAYQLGYNQQLQNVPEWTISERYDIVAWFRRMGLNSRQQNYPVRNTPTVT
jgi:hypothetical protein